MNKYMLIKFRFEIPSVMPLKTANIFGGYLFCHTL